MRRQWIARVVIVGIVMNSVPVWAQEGSAVVRSHANPAAPIVNKVKGCEKPQGLEIAYWNGLMPWQQEERCKQWQRLGPAAAQKPFVPLVPSNPGTIQPYKEPDMVSPKLAIAGIFTAAAGAGLLFHFGYDNVDVLNSTYCVSDWGDVAYGSCGTALDRKVGGIMLLSGVMMVWIGARTKKVKVSSSLGPNDTSVKATIVWGGK